MLAFGTTFAPEVKKVVLFSQVYYIMTAWTDFATKYFREQQKKNPNYKFRDALKAAAKIYKKGSPASSSSSTQKKSKSKKRRTARRHRR